MDVVLAAVERFINPTIAADDEMVGIFRVDPHGVVVDVALGKSQSVPGLASVEGVFRNGLH